MADIIVAVDPGHITGVAILDQIAKTIFVGYQDYKFIAIDGVTEWLDGNYGNRLLKVIIICEKYTITQNTVKMSRQDDALKLNGAFEWYAHQRGYVYEEQSQATAKKQNHDERLQRMDLWTPTSGGHANDATRHLLLGIERHLPGYLDADPLIGYNGEIKVVKRQRD